MGAVDRKSGDRQNWVSVNWLKALLAGVALALCVLAFLLLAQDEHPSAIAAFAMAALPSAAVVLVAYLIGSYLLFRKGLSGYQQLRQEIVEAIVDSSQPVQGLVTVYMDFNSPPWEDLWAEAREVVLVAKYFDGLVLGIVPSLERFWGHRNAVLKVVVPDPRSQAALKSLEPLRGGHLVRNDPLGRVLRGLSTLEKARISQGAPKKALEIYLAHDPIPYAASCFDSEQLLLKAYEYQLEPADRFPRGHFLLSRNEALARFWKAETAELTKGPVFDFARVNQLIEAARQPSA